MTQLVIGALACLFAAPPAPAETPEPTMVVEVPAETQTAVEDEQYLLDEAKRLLEQGALEEALVPLDAYATQFAAEGKLRYDALRLDLEVMTRLGRHESALEELARVRLSAPEHADLLVARGELYAGAKRMKEALGDFEAALRHGKLEGLWHERALTGRAFALLHSGRVHVAHDGLRSYLEKYPEGRFAALAHRTLRSRPPKATERLPDPMPSVH